MTKSLQELDYPGCLVHTTPLGPLVLALFQESIDCEWLSTISWHFHQNSLAVMDILVALKAWYEEYKVVFSIISLLAAPGGIWFLIDKYRNRLRVKIRDIGFPLHDTVMRGIQFEAENVSSKLTSFEPTFTMSGLLPQHNQKPFRQVITFTFDDQNDRQLPPHVSKTFMMWHGEPDNITLTFMWFMVFKWTLTSGKAIHVRALNSHGFRQLGFFRFHWLRLKFLLLGKVPD